MPLCHLFPKGHNDGASPRSFISLAIDVVRPFTLALVPSLWTMYRPRKPVAPNTVAVCPGFDQNDVHRSSSCDIPPSADLENSR